MVFHENGTICGLPSWIGVVTNDTTAYRNDIILAAVNGPCALFAFLSNLVIIVTAIKKPALQKPSNILLCSLAFADCLTAVTAQPMLVAWRFFLQRAQQSCLHQVFAFDVYYTFNVFTVGLSFVNVVIISCDRHYALSRPLSYLTTATRTGKIFFNIKWFKTGFHFTNYHFYPAASNHFFRAPFFLVTCPRPPVFTWPNKYVLQTYGQHNHCLQSVSADSPKSSWKTGRDAMQ